MLSITLNMRHNVAPERLNDLIIGALEGGSNYWYQIDISRSRLVKSAEFISEQPMKGGKLCIKLLEPELVDSIPTRFYDPRGVAEWYLTAGSALEGLKVMGEKYPRHFSNWLQENDDAETADVFLQCALFGEIVFG